MGPVLLFVGSAKVELHQGLQSAVRHSGATMKVHLGAVIGHCEGCNSIHFDFAGEREALADWPVLACSACGRLVNYEDVVIQMEPKALETVSARLRGRRLL